MLGDGIVGTDVLAGIGLFGKVPRTSAFKFVHGGLVFVCKGLFGGKLFGHRLVVWICVNPSHFKFKGVLIDDIFYLDGKHEFYSRQ